MSELDKKFDEAVIKINKLTSKPPDDQLLEVYGLYKQATVGDCDQPKPGMLELKGKAKHEAWNKLKGKTRDQAKQDYINKADSLAKNYNK